jgi:hypothetical protein
MGLFAAATAAVVFAVAPPAAGAAAPVITTVAHFNGYPILTWTLPPSLRSAVVEVANSPATGPDGYFVFENLQIFEQLQPDQVTWTSSFGLDPGAYYVHVAGFDPECAFVTCPGRQWSETAALTVPGPPEVVAKPVVSGVFRTGHRLTATLGTWTGAEPIGYAFQWQRCSVAGDECRSIAGADASRFVAFPGDADGTIRVRVRATNLSGSRDAFSDPHVVAGATMVSGTRLGGWRIGMKYRRGVGRTGTQAFSRSGSCVNGPASASQIDRYSGLRTAWRNGRLFDVATRRVGDRTVSGFVIGRSRVAGVRAKVGSAAILDRHSSERFRLAPVSLSVSQRTGAATYRALTYWFSRRGLLVALETKVGRC